MISHIENHEKSWFWHQNFPLRNFPVFDQIWNIIYNIYTIYIPYTGSNSASKKGWFHTPPAPGQRDPQKRGVEKRSKLAMWSGQNWPIFGSILAFILAPHMEAKIEPPGGPNTTYGRSNRPYGGVKMGPFLDHFYTQMRPKIGQKVSDFLTRFIAVLLLLTTKSGTQKWPFSTKNRPFFRRFLVENHEKSIKIDILMSILDLDFSRFEQ